MGRENFLSVKLNQLRLQLSLAVKLLLQFLCLKLANSLSLPLLATNLDFHLTCPTQKTCSVAKKLQAYFR